MSSAELATLPKWGYVSATVTASEYWSIVLNQSGNRSGRDPNASPMTVFIAFRSNKVSFTSKNNILGRFIGIVLSVTRFGVTLTGVPREYSKTETRSFVLVGQSDSSIPS